MAEEGREPMAQKKPGIDQSVIRDRRHHGAVTEFLAGVDIGKMQFDNGDRQRPDRVVHRDRRVAVCARIDRHPDSLVAGLLQPVDKVTFVIGLPELQLETEIARLLAAVGLDIGERLCTVDARFALAQRIEIGSVDHEDRICH
jgi:hypothetical protein